MRIHDYVNRNYRDRKSRENTAIVILVIICEYARDQGKQYTKRLLPEFLTPRCVIRLDYLQEAAALPREEQTPGRVCEILGCIDPRTARRHLFELNDAITRVTVELACLRSSTPELGALPTGTPSTHPMSLLALVYRAEREARNRAGRDSAPIPSLAELLQAALGKTTEKKPLACVSHPGRPP